MFGDHGLVFGEGDETVPLKSANGLGEDVPYILGNEKHRSMPTEHQQNVIFALTGKNPTEFVDLTLYNNLKTLTSILLIIPRSPVDLQVIDPAGNKIGKDCDYCRFFEARNNFKK